MPVTNATRTCALFAPSKIFPKKKKKHRKNNVIYGLRRFRPSAGRTRRAQNRHIITIIYMYIFTRIVVHACRMLKRFVSARSALDVRGKCGIVSKIPEKGGQNIIIIIII